MAQIKKGEYISKVTGNIYVDISPIRNSDMVFAFNKFTGELWRVPVADLKVINV